MNTLRLSKRSALSFRRVTVRRMPGIPEPGFSIDSLSPGVTVIKGPNASGKTTLAKAMESLVWPATASKGSSVEGELAIADETWVMETVDKKPGRCQRDGADGTRPDLPGADWAGRYRLSLEDLAVAQDHNRTFAALIARETAGGLDLSQLTKSVGATWKPRGPKSAAKELTDAAVALRTATEEQREVAAQEASLSALKERENAARQAQIEARRWESALNVLQTRTALATAQADLDSLPDGMELLSGQEWHRLTEAEEETRRLDDLREDIRARQEHTRRNLVALALPATGISEEMVVQWKRQVERLEEQLRGRDRHIASLQDAASQEQFARQRLGDEPVSDGVILSDAALARLEDYGHKAESLLARKAQLAAEHERLQTELDGLPPKETGLEEGMGAGARWLEETPSAGPRRLAGVLWVLFLLLAIGAGLLAWQLHIGWLGLLVPGILAMVFALRPGREHRGADSRRLLQNEISRLGIGCPSSWTAQAVALWIRDLATRSAAQNTLIVLDNRMTELESRRRLVDKAWTDLKTQRTQLVNDLGIAPHLSEGSPDRIIAPWFAAVSQWSRCAQQLAGERAARTAVEELIDQGIRALLRQMTEAGIASPPNNNGGPLETRVLALGASVQGIEGKRQRHDAFVATLSRLEADLAAADLALARAEERRRGLFHAAGLENGAKDELRLRLDLLEQYGAKRQEVQSAGGAHRESMSRSREVGGQPEDWERPREDLDQQALEARERFAELPGILEEVSRIQTRVESMKEGNRLTQALAQRDRCLDHLQDLQQAEMRWAASHVLLDGMKEHLRQVGRPAVFVKAAELLCAITAGRCTLDMDDDPSKPEFRVKETGDAFTKTLDQLSAATRLQVLLAVRLAFVECQETSFKLPVILDETLANSDDVRSAALADAVLRLAAEGRQVIYLTAQQDEVDKWQQAARSGGFPPPAVIDLASFRL
jgi:energy-coupling factor transporter ATP-binding protein EcfA2